MRQASPIADETRRDKNEMGLRRETWDETARKLMRGDETSMRQKNNLETGRDAILITVVSLTECAVESPSAFAPIVEGLPW